VSELCYTNNPRSLFRKYAKLVTWVGKQFDRDTVLYLPNGAIKQLDEETYRLTVYTRDVNTKLLYQALVAIDCLAYQLTSFQEAQEIVWWFLSGGRLPKLLRSFHFDTTVFNPNASPETTSTDGFVTRAGVSETWATIRVGAGTAADHTTANPTTAFRVFTAGVASNYQEFDRDITLFDTSTLGNVAVIYSAIYSIYTNALNAGTYALKMRIVTSSPASNTTLVAADYSQLGTAAQVTADLAQASFASAGYNDFTLNLTGLGNINPIGITKFGTRDSNDADNVDPGYPGTNSDSRCGIFFAEGANPPKLSITYKRGIDYAYFM